MKWQFAASIFFLVTIVGGAGATGMTPDSVAQGDSDLPTLATVQVRGKVSPPMWEFSRGGKRVIVLGTQYPLRVDSTFYAGMIERYASQSSAMLWPPGLVADDGVGLLRGISLWASVRRAKFNTGDRSLKDVLPPQTYEHWTRLKLKYIGRKSSVERLRPMYAAYELYMAALKKIGMSAENRIYPIIKHVVDRKNAATVDGRFHLAVNSSKGTAKAFEVPAEEDMKCLEQTLDRLEPFLANAPIAADAWAAGDVERYRAIIQRYSHPTACWARLTNEALGRLGGVANPYGQTDAFWVESLHKLIATEDVIITMLPARDVLQATGVVPILMAEGWVVVSLFAEERNNAPNP